MKTIAAPACGTGGFFLAAYDWLVAHNQLDRDEKEFLKNKTFHGNEIVANTRRLCLMNMYLHNIVDITSDSFISSSDALVADTGTVTLCVSKSTIRKKSSTPNQRRRRSRKRRFKLQPSGLLGNNLKQTT
jgi:type I restriction enzyme M protein